MKKRYIIPIFVPHLGCPNDCVFCNQKSISGQQRMITKEDIIKTINFYLENIKDKEAKKEVAFFGGSFTGIDVDKQEEFLQTAYKFIKDGRIDSIKLEKEDNNLFLRIVIDSDEIIDVDKCVEVTNIINPLLDEKDLIKESYILDVSTKEKGR